MESEEGNKRALRLYVTRELHKLGVPTHLKGFHYLRSAVLMSVEDMELVSSVTKLLYPDIAKMYATTGCKVERAIRNAIEVSWPVGNQEKMRDMFGYSCCDGHNRPTNSEYIAGVADSVIAWYKNECQNQKNTQEQAQ